VVGEDVVEIVGEVDEIVGEVEDIVGWVDEVTGGIVSGCSTSPFVTSFVMVAYKYPAAAVGPTRHIAGFFWHAFHIAGPIFQSGFWDNVFVTVGKFTLTGGRLYLLPSTYGDIAVDAVLDEPALTNIAVATVNATKATATGGTVKDTNPMPMPKLRKPSIPCPVGSL